MARTIRRPRTRQQQPQQVDPVEEVVAAQTARRPGMVQRGINTVNRYAAAQQGVEAIAPGATSGRRAPMSDAESAEYWENQYPPGEKRRFNAGGALMMLGPEGTASTAGSRGALQNAAAEQQAQTDYRATPEGRAVQQRIAQTEQETADLQRQERQTRAGTSRVGAALDAIGDINDPATGGRIDWRQAGAARIDPAQAQRMGGQIDYTGFLAQSGVSPEAIGMARGRGALNSGPARDPLEGQRLPEDQRVNPQTIQREQAPIAADRNTAMSRGEMIESVRAAVENNAGMREARQENLDRVQAARDQRYRGEGPLVASRPAQRAARSRAAFEIAIGLLGPGPGEQAQMMRAGRQEADAQRQSNERVAQSRAAGRGQVGQPEQGRPVTMRTRTGVNVEVPQNLLAPPDGGNAINELDQSIQRQVMQGYMDLGRRKMGSAEWAKMVEADQYRYAQDLAEDLGGWQFPSE